MQDTQAISDAYALFLSALLWFPFAILGNFASAVLSRIHGGRNAVQIQSIWKNWVSSLATLVVVFVALLLWAATDQLNLASTILTGLAGDKALNNWKVARKPAGAGE